MANEASCAQANFHGGDNSGPPRLVQRAAQVVTWAENANVPQGWGQVTAQISASPGRNPGVQQA